jgi:hypothetical protein
MLTQNTLSTEKLLLTLQLLSALHCAALETPFHYKQGMGKATNRYQRYSLDIVAGPDPRPPLPVKRSLVKQDNPAMIVLFIASVLGVNPD